MDRWRASLEAMAAEHAALKVEEEAAARLEALANRVAGRSVNEIAPEDLKAVADLLDLPDIANLAGAHEWPQERKDALFAAFATRFPDVAGAQGADTEDSNGLRTDAYAGGPEDESH
jgi:hypothetical protein